MGIFKDFATSGYGDVTIGALEGLNQVAQRDAVFNAGVAESSLNKYNAEFANTELAFKNRDQLVNILSDSPEVFGILPQGNLNVKQVADATVGKIFANNRSLFEQKDFNDVQRLFAFELAKAGPEGVKIDDPYVPSANLFEREKQKHAATLSEISKMPRADKLLMNIEKATSEVPQAEAVTDLQIKGAAITAKGFGLLNTYPDDAAGRDLLQVTQLMIINNNARQIHPNDLEARQAFVQKKMFENDIDGQRVLAFKKPITYNAISTILQDTAKASSMQMTMGFNQLAAAKNPEEQKAAMTKINGILYNTLETINNASDVSGVLTGQEPKPMVERKEVVTAQKIDAPVDFKPTIDNMGKVTIATGSKVPITEIIANFGTYKKTLSDETIAFVNQFVPYFQADGTMIEPQRTFFPDGDQGDKLYSRFLTMYNNLYPEMDLATLGGYGFIESPPKRKKKEKKSFIETQDLPKKSQEQKDK